MKKLSIYNLFFLFCIWHKCEILDAASTNREIGKVCQTTGCENAATTILQSIDLGVSPCEDFYKFACGNYIKTAAIPKDEQSVDHYSSLNQKIREQLKSILEEPTQPNEPRFITLSKNFYKACMDTTAIEKNGLKTALAKFKEAGGWPLLEGDSWKEKNFDWIQATYDLQRSGYDMYYLISLDVMPTDYLNSTKNMININQPFLSLEREFIANKTIVSAYYKYMVELSVLYGADRARAEKESKEVLDFQIELANITISEDDRIKQADHSNLMTVEELTKKYPTISWKEYLNKMLDSTSIKLGDDEVIQVGTTAFFDKFGALIAKTSRRVLANYIFWQAAEAGVPYVTREVMKLRMDYADVRYGPSPYFENTPRWKDCSDMPSYLLRASVGSLYNRKHFDKETKKNAEEIAVNVEAQFKKIIKEAAWMDEKSIAGAMDKLESLKILIGSIDETVDDKTIDEYYKTVEITPNDLLQAFLNISSFRRIDGFNQLRKPVSKSNWAILMNNKFTESNPEYKGDFNILDIPATILQDIFFDEERPNYLNYAGIGPFIIANEMTRAVNEKGSKYDKNGNPKDLWTPETRKKFVQKAACITQQYENYTVKDGGIKTNDTFNEGINVANDGGVKISYLAYQDWVKSHGPEPTLPKLNYSQSQLFWIQTAITQCAKYTPEILKNFALNSQFFEGFNSPSEFSVTGLFANRPEFAKDFHCPVGSRMNPVNKCSVW